MGGNLRRDGPKAHSTVNPPLFEEDDDLLVISKCPTPELHMLQGALNHIFWQGLVPLMGRDQALAWPLKLKVIPKNYQGEIFEGNACRVMVRSADKILEPDVLKDTSPIDVMPFVAALKGLDLVVGDCFSTKKVSPDTSKHIEELRKLFDGTGLSETLKIHTILEHIEDCLDALEEDWGLGLWSEQAGESIHREFLKYWLRYKINIISDSTYGERLLKAVVEFSSRHI